MPDRETFYAPASECICRVGSAIVTVRSGTYAPLERGGVQKNIILLFHSPARLFSERHNHSPL